MSITREELYAIDRLIYDCNTCPYPSYRDKDKIFCSCCWQKAIDPHYWDKVRTMQAELFADSEDKTKIRRAKQHVTKRGLVKNKHGYYVKVKN